MATEVFIHSSRAMRLVKESPAHVGTSAVRYIPKTPFVDKAKSHSRSEGEQTDAWKQTVAAAQ